MTSSAERKPYERPELRRCGTLVELTLGGRGSKNDNRGTSAGSH